MAETLDLSLFAKPAGNGTLGMDVAVEGIACGHNVGNEGEEIVNQMLENAEDQ